MEHKLSVKPLVFGALGIVLASAVFVIFLTFIGESTKVVIGYNNFNVRIISSEIERSKIVLGGLEISGDEKLLLAFPSDGIYSVTMKNVAKPIDILWLNSAKKIIHIQTTSDSEIGRNITYKSITPARYIIELPSGSVKDSEIKVNQTADFSINPKDVN